MSSLNPFGSSSEDEESDVEPVVPPVPAPRKLKTPPPVVEEPAVIEEKIENIVVKEEPR
jgi:hypothetical protein